MKRKLLPRILIFMLGVAFILRGATLMALGFFGDQTTAVITHIRREGGERTDGKPGRYTYNISYTFTLPGGKEINGTTKKIRNGAYVKADGTSTLPVRYFQRFPCLNAMESGIEPRVGPLVLLITGGCLCFLICKRPDNEHSICSGGLKK